MLCALVFLILLFSFSKLEVSNTQANSCPAQLQESFIQDSLKVAEKIKQDKEFQSFLSHSSQQKGTVLKDPAFQDFVTGLHTQAALQASQYQQKADDEQDHKISTANNPGNLYIFVSFSLGEKALLNLAQEAKAYGATLVLRGFKDGSYAQTVKSLQKIVLKTGQGVLIDSELFSLFSVTAVPTYVLAKPFQLQAQERIQTPLHDRLQGHVSISYVLEVFAKEGSLQEEAHSLLANTQLERGRLQ